MTRTIWKYTVEFGIPGQADTTELQMPRGATVISADLGLMPDSMGVHHTIELWAEVDQHAALDQVLPTETRTFTVVGTGHPLPDRLTRHIVTVRDGQFVWHLLELLPVPPAALPGPLDNYDEEDWDTAGERRPTAGRGRLARLLHAHRQGVPIVVVSTGSWARQMADAVGLFPDEWRRLDEERDPLPHGDVVLLIEPGAETPDVLRGHRVHRVLVRS